MKLFDINTAIGHWPFQQLPYESAAALEAHLKKYDISGALTVNTHGLFYRDVQNANIELAQWIGGNPFFTGCASINPAYPQWEKDLQRCVEEFNFRAMRLTPPYHGYEADSPLTDKALDAAEKFDIPVLIPQRIMDLRQRHHLDVSNIVAPETIFELAKRHPLCRIVCTETLISDVELVQLAPLKNVSIELSRQLTGFSGVFRRVADTIGADRILFGSGAPFKEVLPSVIKILDSGLPEEALHKIAYQNSNMLLQRRKNI